MLLSCANGLVGQMQLHPPNSLADIGESRLAQEIIDLLKYNLNCDMIYSLQI